MHSYKEINKSRHAAGKTYAEKCIKEQQDLIAEEAKTSSDEKVGDESEGATPRPAKKKGKSDMKTGDYTVS